ncbi:hypothetical protein NLX62_06585, partial [Mycobacteriaceae bacterium Msp059]|nr:hypothetical protein [Mycobacteriaceae bacterium Msp059]
VCGFRRRTRRGCSADEPVESRTFGYLRCMPKGKGIYDEEHRDQRGDDGDAAGKSGAKKVPEDTPDVDTSESTSHEPPD